MICAREPCSPSILAALSELSRVVGTSCWASVRPGPDSDPGYTLVASSALKSALLGSRGQPLGQPLTYDLNVITRKGVTASSD
jgi:hypothetical protein